MSEKQWYEDVPSDEMADKHVRAVMDSGTVVEGCLKYWDSRLVTVYMGSMVEGIYVLRSIDDRWQLMKGVKSLDLVWDESDWEELGPDDYGKADAIVVNGRLIRVNGISAHHQFRPVVGFSVSFEHVSCALRCRHRLPTELGAYRGADGTLLMLTDIGLPDKWVCVSEDFKECGVFLGDEQAEEHLPLTPVHFVDGRAE